MGTTPPPWEKMKRMFGKRLKLPVHTVVALSNTAVEGMSGAFPVELRNAIYDGAA